MTQEKKKFNLTNDMIELSSPVDINTITRPRPVMTKITLSVPKHFSQEFKAWCATHGITMSNALQLAYSKIKNQKI